MAIGHSSRAGRTCSSALRKQSPERETTLEAGRDWSVEEEWGRADAQQEPAARFRE
jgi:hypothetical protein